MSRITKYFMIILLIILLYNCNEMNKDTNCDKEYKEYLFLINSLKFNDTMPILKNINCGHGNYIQSYIKEFNEENIKYYIFFYNDFKTYYIYTKNNKVVSIWVK